MDKKDLLELEVNGQVGATGAAEVEEGNGGREVVRLGERGLLEVKNSWTLWCLRTRQGSTVRHLGASRQTGPQGDRQGDNQRDAVRRPLTDFKICEAVSRSSGLHDAFTG